MTGCSIRTITKLAGYIRELLVEMFEISDVFIRGADGVAEIDKTKLSKRKYNKGHRVVGIWVSIGIKMTPERWFFCVELPDKTEETINFF